MAVPATIIAGPVLAWFFRKVKNQPPPDLYRPREFLGHPSVPALSVWVHRSRRADRG
jgi:hypothetical protein